MALLLLASSNQPYSLTKAFNMFICIDRARLCVLYKHEDQAAIVSLANLEIPENAIVVMSATDPDSYERFTDFELKVLFENLCGEKHTGYNRPFLIKSVTMLVRLLTESKINPIEVEQQLASVGCTDEQYKYAPGCSVPSKQIDLYVPTALVTVAGYVPYPKLYHVPSARQSVFKAVAGVNKIVAAMQGNSEPELGAPRVPRPRTEGPVTAPAVGSKTGKVWELAEKCYAQHATIDKVLRKMVADACESAGINSSTMSVQYSKWKQTKQ